MFTIFHKMFQVLTIFCFRFVKGCKCVTRFITLFQISRENKQNLNQFKVIFEVLVLISRFNETHSESNLLRLNFWCNKDFELFAAMLVS